MKAGLEGRNRSRLARDSLLSQSGALAFILHSVVSNAGYAQKEEVLRGTVGSIMEETAKNRLPFEYLIYVGGFLE